MDTPATDALKQIQGICGVKQDADWGDISQAAFDHLKGLAHLEQTRGTVHTVKASSFADPADVAAFRACKAKGHSDDYCYDFGDNGEGKWGDDTTGPTPMCALPPDDWTPLGPHARGAKVAVTVNGKTVICELRDTMPWKKDITNGAGIDLAPGAVAAFGLKAPIYVPATWQWA